MDGEAKMESTNLPAVLSWLGGFESVHGWFASITMGCLIRYRSLLIVRTGFVWVGLCLTACGAAAACLTPECPGLILRKHNRAAPASSCLNL